MKEVFSSVNEKRIKALNVRFLKHHDHLIETYVTPLAEDEKHDPHACEFRLLVSKCVNCDLVLSAIMVGVELSAKLLDEASQS